MLLKICLISLSRDVNCVHDGVPSNNTYSTLGIRWQNMMKIFWFGFRLA
jgi:hypothetical protein